MIAQRKYLGGRMVNPQLLEFGLHLKKLRLARGLSQEQLGLIADLDRTYISGIERLVKNPTITTVAKIGHALNCRMGDLLDK